MSYQHRSEDKHEDLSKEQIYDRLLRLELPGSIASSARLYERGLEVACRGRNILVGILMDDWIRSIPALDQGVLNHDEVKQYLGSNKASDEKALDPASVSLAKIKLRLSDAILDVIDVELPKPLEQPHMREMLGLRDSAVQEFLQSEQGTEFKTLVSTWWKLEENQESKSNRLVGNDDPLHAVYPRLVISFAQKRPRNIPEVRDYLQKEMAPSE